MKIIQDKNETIKYILWFRRINRMIGNIFTASNQIRSSLNNTPGSDPNTDNTITANSQWALWYKSFSHMSGNTCQYENIKISFSSLLLNWVSEINTNTPCTQISVFVKNKVLWRKPFLSAFEMSTHTFAVASVALPLILLSCPREGNHTKSSIIWCKTRNSWQSGSAHVSCTYKK